MRGQTAADLVERLHAAEELTALDATSLGPWHLKLNVQLFNAKGKPEETGIIEEWRSGPKMWSISYAFPNYSGTWIENSDGEFRTEAIGSPPLLLELLLRQVVHPMPGAREIDASTPEMRKINFGKIPLECIMLSQPIKNVHELPMGLYPTYCFDPGKDALRASYDFGSQLILRNAIGTFQQHKVSTEISISNSGLSLASAHVEVLAGAEMDPTKFVVTDDMKPVGATAKIGAGVMAGTIVSKVQPVYPSSARAAHVSGSVVLRALIGRDGRIHSLKLMSFGDPDLAIAAIAAVRQWTYKPYLLMGEPTEVETTITVNFNIN